MIEHERGINIVSERERKKRRRQIDILFSKGERARMNKNMMKGSKIMFQNFFPLPIFDISPYKQHKAKPHIIQFVASFVACLLQAFSAGVEKNQLLSQKNSKKIPKSKDVFIITGRKQGKKSSKSLKLQFYYEILPLTKQSQIKMEFICYIRDIFQR